MKQKVQVGALPIQHHVEGLPLKIPNGQWHTWSSCPQGETFTPYHLYFTTDEEINMNEWYLGWIEKDRWKLIQATNNRLHSENFRKIVATTNPDLHSLGGKSTRSDVYLPSEIYKIPQDFIQYFVEKQGNVKEVMLEYYDPKTAEKFKHFAPDDLNIMDKQRAEQLWDKYERNNNLKLNPDGSVIWSPVEERKYTSQDLEDAFYAGRKQVDHPAFIIYEYNSFSDYKRNLK